MKEKWKDIRGFEGYYKISNYGRVWSCPRKVKHWRGGYKFIPGRYLKLSYTTKGYIRARLNLNGRSYNKQAHRLVAKAFIPNPNNLPEINHINFIPDDNRVENLEWTTRSQNMYHSGLHGRGLSCGNHHQSRLTKIQVIFIKENEWRFTPKELAEAFDVDRWTVRSIQMGLHWGSFHRYKKLY